MVLNEPSGRLHQSLKVLPPVNEHFNTALDWNTYRLNDRSPKNAKIDAKKCEMFQKSLALQMKTNVLDQLEPFNFSILFGCTNGVWFIQDPQTFRNAVHQALMTKSAAASLASRSYLTKKDLLWNQGAYCLPGKKSSIICLKGTPPTTSSPKPEQKCKITDRR